MPVETAVARPCAHAVVAAILRRRSISPRRLLAPGPGEGHVRLLVEAALAAPDHGRLRPIRFIAIGNDDRRSLAMVFVAGTRELAPDMPDDALQRDAEKAHHAPCLLAVVAHIVEDQHIIPATEQWIAIGAAVENVLLAAEDLGYGAMIVSGQKVRTKALREAFGLASDEHLVGFIALGTPESPPRPADRPAAGEHLAHWVPPRIYR